MYPDHASNKNHTLQLSLEGKARKLNLPFNVATPEIPFKSVIDEISKPLPAPEGCSGLHLAGQEIIENNWKKTALVIARERLKFCAKQAIPFYRSEFEPFESRACVLSAELDLCDGCLNLLLPGAVEFSYPCPWWQALMLEQKREDITAITEEREDQKNRKKRGWDKEEREIQRQLKDWDNPYSHNNPAQRQRYNLVNAAIRIGQPRYTDSEKRKQKRKVFRGKYWEPYLNARLLWIRDLKKSAFKYVYVEDGKLYKQITGTHRECLYPPPQINFRGGRGKSQSI